MNRQLGADAMHALLVIVLASSLAGTGCLLLSAGPSSGLDELLGLCASATGTGLAVWWLLSTCLAMASALFTAAGRPTCARLTGALVPGFMRRLALGVLGLTLVAAPAAHAASEPLDPTWQATTAESVSAAPSAKVETGIPELLREQGLEPPLEVAKPTQRPMERVEELGAPPPVPGRSSGVDDAELASPKAWTPPASPAPNGLLTRAQTRDSVAPHRTVEVRPGDSLWSIAARHLGPGASATDIAEAWPEWFEANRSVIGDNPHMIRAGLLLDAPQR